MADSTDPYHLPAADYLAFSQIIWEEIARGDLLHTIDDFTEYSVGEPQHRGATRVLPTDEPEHGAPQLDL